MCKISRFLDWGMNRWRRFTLCDVAACKLCLISLGALFGVYCSKFCRRIAPLIWIAAAASWVYLIWRLVLRDD